MNDYLTQVLNAVMADEPQDVEQMFGMWPDSPYTVSLARSITFETCHQLPMTPVGHKCRNLHGHSYRVELWVRGHVRKDGFVVDNAELDDTLKVVRATFDHSPKGSMNEMGFPGLSDNPTAERLAIWIWRLARANPAFEGCDIKVRIYEGPNSVFEYAHGWDPT